MAGSSHVFQIQRYPSRFCLANKDFLHTLMKISWDFPGWSDKLGKTCRVCRLPGFNCCLKFENFK